MLKENITLWIDSSLNYFKRKHEPLTNWNDPIISIADANDKLFFKLKEIIGKSHVHPKELLANAETVIVYFIPFSKEIVKSNRGLNTCSKEWAHAYIETNKLITEINNFLTKKLKLNGFDAKPMPATHNFNEEELISDWSHKHVGYIAGLGDFGLHQMLITEKGCCGRLGSLITSAKIGPTKRSEKKYCLYYYNKSCLKCVENCIFDALKIGIFNKQKCYDVCLENARIYSDLGLVDACGKCISIVPCFFKNPVPS